MGAAKTIDNKTDRRERIYCNQYGTYGHTCSAPAWILDLAKSSRVDCEVIDGVNRGFPHDLGPSIRFYRKDGSDLGRVFFNADDPSRRPHVAYPRYRVCSAAGQSVALESEGDLEGAICDLLSGVLGGDS
tara:strand:+ start:123 stop:512 length:390 start_codon:yes stop_codon:yes gene_type:complete